MPVLSPPLSVQCLRCAWPEGTPGSFGGSANVGRGYSSWCGGPCSHVLGDTAIPPCRRPISYPGRMGPAQGCATMQTVHSTQLTLGTLPRHRSCVSALKPCLCACSSSSRWADLMRRPLRPVGFPGLYPLDRPDNHVEVASALQVF